MAILVAMDRIDGAFLVERKLGAGAFAEAFLARDADGRRVVVKLLQERFAANPRSLERFRREIRALEKVRHPNVAALRAHGVCSASGRSYYVMDWSAGVALADLLATRGSLPPLVALSLVAQLLSALVETHAAGVVHRDLKPENLLVEGESGPEPVLRVIDFGLAKHLEGGERTRQALTGHMVGTPAYMPPEQCRGDPMGPPCDLYATGCILFELLAGAPPFDGTIPEVAQKHVHAVAPRLETVLPGAPRELGDLVALLLEKEPARRPDAVAARARLDEVRSRLAADPRSLAQLASASFRAVRTVIDAAPLAAPTPGDALRATGEPTVFAPLERDLAAETVGEDALRARLEAGTGVLVVLLAGPAIRFGRGNATGGRRENDLLLRVFPREGEPAEQAAKRTMNVSRRHGTFRLSRAGAFVEDEGTKFGTTLDGVAIRPRERVQLPDRFRLRIGGELELRGRVLRDAEGVAALVLDRTDGGRHVYALVVSGLPVGSSSEDGLRLEGAAPGHARIEASARAFAVTALREDAPVEVSGHALLVGERQPLVPGDTVVLGRASLRLLDLEEEELKRPGVRA